MDNKFKISELKAIVPTVRVGWRFIHALIDGIIIVLISKSLNQFLHTGFTIDIIVFPLYYVLFEYFLQRTPGKYISKTMVVNDYGEKSNFSTILLRTLLRFIPFEPLSCLDDYSKGWHDRWSKTYVIKESYLPKLQMRLKEQSKSKTSNR